MNSCGIYLPYFYPGTTRSLIDQDKTFDLISRQALWEILDNRRLNKKLMRMIKSMYRKSKNVLKIKDIDSRGFKTKKEFKCTIHYIDG